MYNKMKLLKTCKKERDLTAGKPFYIKTTRVTDTRSYGWPKPQYMLVQHMDQYEADDI